MCFDLDSHPPIVPIAGGALDSATLTLTAEDGARFSAFRARAASPTGAGMIVLPDVRGLHPYYEELALRLAEHGVNAIAIDYFGRTAFEQPRGDGFEFMPHVGQTTWAGLSSDIRAAAAELRSSDGGGATSLFSMGFCMGGRLAFLSSTLGLDLAGVVGFYGWPTGPARNDSPAPVDMVGAMEGGVLAIFGGADQGIPASSVVEFKKALTGAGVDHKVITYPGEAHGFFDKKLPEAEAASQAAWDETLAFIQAGTNDPG